MVSLAKTLKVFPLQSEFLALLKEAELIREFKPKYNISLKDDKSPDYIIISKDKIIPEITVVRQNQVNQFNNVEIFGPFLSSKSLKTVLKIGRRIFPYCDRPNQNVHKKPCFYYHLNLCPGICVGKISSGNYKRQIKRLILFLRGDHQKLLRQLTIDMKRKSKMLDYESASKIREQIGAINNLNTINAFSEFSTSVIPGATPVIPGTSSVIPTQSVIPEKRCHSHESGNLFRYRFLVKPGMTSESTGMTKSGRIEGYDISHLQGKWATASMVVFINGKPAKEEYRQFRIKSFPSSDDPKMLAETLMRRFLHPEWEFPKLIMIDGGEPQLREIFKYFKKLPVKLPRIVGLVKGEETIIIPENNLYKRINLPKSDPFLKTLMALRDEAHRFARRYHHKLHLKSLVDNSQTA